MATTRILKSGNFQAVRLPKGLRLKGPYVEIFRGRDEIVLREKPKKKRGLAEAFDILASMPNDAFENIRDERSPEERQGAARPRRSG
jgi:antitoxin VapB